MVKSAGAKKKIIKGENELLVDAIVKGLEEKKAKDITIMDLRGIRGAMSDFFVVCHGESSTQVEALARSVEESVFKEFGENPLHLEGMKNAQWVLIDYIHVVVHVFQREQREYYGIERLWADAEFHHIPS